MKFSAIKFLHFNSDNHPKSSNWLGVLSLLWLLVLGWVAFGWHLGSTGLLDETEPLFAEAARLMTVTGDWITPYFNGEPRFDKPPLIYWLMAIAYQMFGVSSWAARLPSALSAFALVVFVFLTLRRFTVPPVPLTGNPAVGAAAVGASEPIPFTPRRQAWWSAWIGAAIAALTPLTLAWARIGVSDMLLNGCMSSALLAFFWGYTQPAKAPGKTWGYLAFYILTALAVLAKGPVGVVLPGLIILAFLFYVGNLRDVLKEMRLIRGGLIFAALVIPWYVLVIGANGETYINSFFGYHNVERFTRVVNNHGAPWYFYFPVVFLGFLPWSFHLPVAIARLRFWQRRPWQQQPRSAQLGLFALVWFAVIFGFFTIAATKLPSYVIPLMPAAAILVGLFWGERMMQRRSPRATQITNILSLIFLAGFAITFPLGYRWADGDPAMPYFAESLRASDILLWGAGAWAIATLLGVGLLIGRKGYWLWFAHLVGWLLFISVTLLPLMAIVDTHRQLPLRQLSAAIVQHQQPGEEVILFGMPKPSVSFYTERPITYSSTINQTRNYLNRRLRRRRTESLLVLTQSHKVEQLELSPEQIEPIAESGAYELIRVTPKFFGLQ